MVEDLFDTHKFLFTMNYENNAKGHKIEYYDKTNTLQKVEIKELIVNTTPISCRVITPENKKIAIPYIRVHKVFNSNNEVVWDMTDKELPKMKIIGGYQ